MVDRPKSDPSICSGDSSWTTIEKRNGVEVAFTNCNYRNFLINIKRNSESLQLNLNKLDIPWKTPELSWVNHEMMCITTWWSGPFVEYVFIPLNGKMKDFIYFDQPLDYVDSTTNIVVYDDRINDKNSIQLTVENLTSRKKIIVKVPIDSISKNTEKKLIFIIDGMLDVSIDKFHKKYDISNLLSTKKL